MAGLLESLSVPPLSLTRGRRCWESNHRGRGVVAASMIMSLNPSPPRRRLHAVTCCHNGVTKRKAMSLMLSSLILLQDGLYANALTKPTIGLREYIDSFDGYSFRYPSNWIPVRGAGADIFFRDPYVLDENLSMDISSPSSSNYTTIEDLGTPQAAAERILKQYLTEFMSTRIGVRRESSIRSASSRVADDGKLYYQVEVNIKSYANNKELAVMPQDRVARLEWDRRYLSVLGVENKQLYELRLQTPENVFLEEESDLRQVMDSFRVFKVTT